VHASLSSLTTLIPIVDQSGLQTYGDMAHSLTEKKAASYISLLPEDEQEAARFSVGLDRAIFIAALADAQYSFVAIEMETYLEQLNAFNLTGKNQSAHALSAEAEARMEFCLSTIDRFQSSPDAPAQIMWKQLTTAQDLYSAALKLDDDDAVERKAKTYASKGDLELLRHRLASMPQSSLSDGVKRSAKTLAQNALKFYKGAAQLARSSGDQELEVKAKQRWGIAADVAAVMYGVPAFEVPPADDPTNARGDTMEALESVINEGLIDMALGEDIVRSRGR
jgi:hypothetical protein